MIRACLAGSHGETVAKDETPMGKSETQWETPANLLPKPQWAGYAILILARGKNSGSDELMQVCRKCGGIIPPADHTKEDLQDIRTRTDMDICSCDEMTQWLQRGSLFY